MVVLGGLKFLMSEVPLYTVAGVTLPPEGRARLQALATRPVQGYLAHNKLPPPLGPP